MYFVLLLYCWAAKAIHRSSTPSSTTSTARLAIYCRAPRQQSRPSPSAGPSGSILSFREDLAAALCSSTVHELFVRHRNFVSTVRQSDSKQKAWGAIRMWSPLPPRSTVLVSKHMCCQSSVFLFVVEEVPHHHSSGILSKRMKCNYQTW